MVQSGKEKRMPRLTPVSDSKTREQARQLWYSAKLNEEVSDIAALSMLKHEQDSKTRNYLLGAVASFIHKRQHLGKIASMMVDFVKSPDEEERYIAVSAIAKYLQQYDGNKAYIRILSDALQDPSQRISFVASKGLQDYAERSNENASVVMNVVPPESSALDAVRRNYSVSMLPPKPAGGSMKIKDLKTCINALYDEKKKSKASIELEKYIQEGTQNARRVAGLILIAGKNENTDAVYQICMKVINS
ncbi:hypothetical protein JXA56_05710 [Candidatus Micrarchaeota archaeon]|nr:hypothetical protein [Candidatus Micrarchaeota archaeon]